MRGRRQRASSPLRHPLRSRGLQCPRRPLPSHSPTAAHSVPTECSLTPALAGRATRHRHHAQPARSPSSPLRIPWPTLPLHLGSPLQHKSAFATRALTLLTPPWCLNRRPKRPVPLRPWSALPSRPPYPPQEGCRPFQAHSQPHRCRRRVLPWPPTNLGGEALIAGLTPGSAHCTGKPRGSGWDSGRTKLPNPRAPPTPSDADRGGGWERVRRDCRAEGSLEATAQSKR